MRDTVGQLKYAKTLVFDDFLSPVRRMEIDLFFMNVGDHVSLGFPGEGIQLSVLRCSREFIVLANFPCSGRREG